MSKHVIETCEVVADSGKAICVESPNFDKPEWIPQSQVHEDSEVWKVGDVGDLVVTGWWARKQGWV